VEHIKSLKFELAKRPFSTQSAEEAALTNLEACGRKSLSQHYLSN